MLSTENRWSDIPLAELSDTAPGVEPVPNPLIACPKILLLPGAVDGLAPKRVPNPLPTEVDAEEKLNPDAEPNPEAAAGVLDVGALKDKDAAETAEGAAEPNPEGACVGTTDESPKPNEDDGAAEEPKPLLPAAKLKVDAWTGVEPPNPTVSERFILISKS